MSNGVLLEGGPFKGRRLLPLDATYPESLWLRVEVRREDGRPVVVAPLYWSWYKLGEASDAVYEYQVDVSNPGETY